MVVPEVPRAKAACEAPTQRDSRRCLVTTSISATQSRLPWQTGSLGDPRLSRSEGWRSPGAWDAARIRAHHLRTALAGS